MVKDMSLSLHHKMVSLVICLQSLEWVPPIFLRYATAVWFSDNTLMLQCLNFEHRDFRPKRTALISR